MSLISTAEPKAELEASSQLETLTLGAGCFWCVEAVLLQVEGVHSAVSGYMGGHVENPTYEDISTKKSGHVEVVQVRYNPAVLSTGRLLEWFWALHDPTTLNRQGNDVGPQYASVLFYHSEEQKRLAEASMQTHGEEFKDPIVTVIRPAQTFYVAEDYHQNYYALNKTKNPYCRYVITPKLKKLKLDY